MPGRPGNGVTVLSPAVGSGMDKSLAAVQLQYSTQLGRGGSSRELNNQRSIATCTPQQKGWAGDQARCGALLAACCT